MLLLILLLVSAVNGDGNTLEAQELDPLWEDILTEGGLLQSFAKSKRFIGINDNQIDQQDQQCVLPNGRAGRCRPVRQCMRPEFKNNYLRFMEYACVLKNSGIGVCCPEQRRMGGVEGLAGELPATAPKEEQNEAVMKVTRAENRGCGLSTRAQSRVIGARPANPREWPWMASVTPEGELQYCGGVLITDRHVLTAAHCTRKWKAEDLYVRLGEYDLKRSNDSRTYNFRVIEIRQHEGYEVSNYRNDIAILKLHRQAVFNTYVWPICLPPPDLPLTNQTAIVIGWGTQFYGGPNSNVLMEVSIPVWDHERCVASFTETVFDETICAGGPEGGKDSCQGDSGGPLMYQMSSGRWAVIGVVSWGVRCGEPNHPGIYARVDNFLDWILLNAKF